MEAVLREEEEVAAAALAWAWFRSWACWPSYCDSIRYETKSQPRSVRLSRATHLMFTEYKARLTCYLVLQLGMKRRQDTSLEQKTNTQTVHYYKQIISGHYTVAVDIYKQLRVHELRSVVANRDCVISSDGLFQQSLGTIEAPALL
jgi:hypothetical protein